jgi:hypothetical protein
MTCFVGRVDGAPCMHNKFLALVTLSLLSTMAAGIFLSWFSFVSITGIFLYLLYSLWSSYLKRRAQLGRQLRQRQEAGARLQLEWRQEALQNQDLQDTESNVNKSLRRQQILDALNIEILNKKTDDTTNDVQAESDKDKTAIDDTVVDENETNAIISMIGKFFSIMPSDSTDESRIHNAFDNATTDVKDTVDASNTIDSQENNDSSITSVVAEEDSKAPSSGLTSVCSMKEKSQVECCICLEPYETGQVVCSAKTTDCDHMFHEACAFQWLHDHSQCPLCRVTLIPESGEK